MKFRIEVKPRGYSEEYYRLYTDDETEYFTREAANKSMNEIRTKYGNAFHNPFSFRVKGYHK